VYRWVEHTSEAELSVEAETRELVLSEAALALGQLFDGAPSGEPAERKLSVRAADLPALLAEWLGELAYLAETDGFIAERVVRIDLEDSSVKALVSGRRSEPQYLVKAVTYHRLAFEPTDGAWRGRVVLDV
jgi:protein archease